MWVRAARLIAGQRRTIDNPAEITEIAKRIASKRICLEFTTLSRPEIKQVIQELEEMGIIETSTTHRKELRLVMKLTGVIQRTQNPG